MTKTTLKLLLFNLMVFSTILTFGQNIRPNAVTNGNQIINSQSSALQAQGYELPDYSSTNQKGINNSQSTSNHKSQAVVDVVKTDFTPWMSAPRGFDQDSAIVLFTESFDTYSPETPTGWYVAGDASTNWKVFAGTNAGGTPFEAAFYHSPTFNGYTKLVADTVMNTTGYNTLALSFKTKMAYNNDGWIARVETTSDGGTTWNTAWERLVNSSLDPTTLLIIINTPDVGSENFQFAISYQGLASNFGSWNFDDILLTEGPTEVSNITYNVYDLDSIAVENARITLEDYGTVYTDENGQVVYKNVLPGNYDYNITAQDLAIIKDSLVLTDSDLTLDIYMYEPIYLYYEDFTMEPNGWTKHLTERNLIYWLTESMRFSPNAEGEMLYVTPEIDLYKDSTIVIEVGDAYSGGTIGVGIVTDPNDSTTYTQIAQFALESNYKYYDLVFPEEYSTAKHLAFKNLGGVGKGFNLTTMYLEPKAAYTPRVVSFIVKDAEGNYVEDAQVSLQSNGTKTTDSVGQVFFNSVFDGTYEWAVNAGLDYSRSSGILDMEQNDTIIEVQMQAPAYYFFDDFMGGQINDWSFITSGTKRCQWWDGALFFYHSDAITDPVFAVSPSIDLSNVATVTAYVGGNANGTGVLTFGTFSDPQDSTTFTPLTSFNVGKAYQYLTVNISEYTGSDKYFGFRSVGPQYNFFYMPMVFMEAKPETPTQAVTFVVKDEDNHAYEGATIEIPGFGPIVTNSEGNALIDLYNFKSYEYTVYSDDLFDRVRTFDLGNVEEIINVPMKNKAGFFFLEEFKEGIPYTWKQIVSTGDGIEWWNGEIIFYNYLDSEDPLMLVSPEINLTKVDSITIETGVELINHGRIIIGSLTDQTDPNTFQELGVVESQYDLEFATIDVSDIDIEGSYLGFKCEGEVPSYMVLKTIYVEGRGKTAYCMDSSLSKDGWISNVAFDDINNASDWQTEVGDYTHISTRLQANKPELITVTNGNPKASDVVTAWVDWDQNFEFEADMGEEYILSSTDDGSTFVAEIEVPEGIDYGKFQLRIRLTNDGTPAPCGTLSNGETEDYVLKVSDERESSAGIVFADNFDAYTAGQLVACQNPEYWTTTDLDPCGAKDALVINDQSNSGSNSAYIISGDDLVLDLDQGYTTGKHSISSMLYIPTGGKAQINILSTFTPTIEYAFEAIFSNNGTGSVNADSSAAATFNFANDAWIECEVVVDLNNDEAEFYLDGVSIIKWQWTKGATGEGSALKLAAINFSGKTGGSNFYIDDVTLEKLPVYPPLGFEAKVFDGDNALLEWIAPLAEESISWDDGSNKSALGYGGGTPFFVASHWNPEELKHYDENYITSITFFPNDVGTFTLKAWLGSAAETLILSQELSVINVGEFNTITLETPIKINAFEDLWFGYKVTDYSGSPAGYDNGPAVQRKGNMISMDGVSWFTLSSRDYNWNLSAYVSASANGKALAKPMVKENIALVPDLNLELLVSPETNASEVKRSTNKSKAKAEEGFVGYNIYRNGEMIKDSLNTTYFVDTNLTQGTHAYEVKAVFEEGISASAKPGAINVNVGALVPRDLVIIEVATGTWCVNCPGVAMACEEMVENGHKVGVIEYHYGDEYQTTEAMARIDYYDISGYPSSFFDGLDNISGGSPSTSMYPQFVPKTEDRLLVATPIKLESFFYNTNDNNYRVDIKTELIGGYENIQNLKVFAALTESHIADEWFIMETVDFVLRDMIPTETGTTIDFASDSVQSFQFDYKYYDVYNADNMELVVFVQDVVTKEILQGTIALEGVPPLAAPYNLSGPAEELINTDFRFVWDAPDVADNNLTGYNVYRQMGDAEFTLLGNTTELSYTDNIVDAGVVNYYVTAVYDEGESSASNTLTIDVVTSVEESIFNNTSLYPNPASKVVNITSEYSIEEVSVFNYLGQEIFTEKVNSKIYKMNTSDFDSGIYLFQIKTQEGQIAKQIIIE